MSDIIKAVICLVCAFLVAIQQDELGEALINGHKALMGVMLVLILMGLYHVMMFVSEKIEDDDDDD